MFRLRSALAAGILGAGMTIALAGAASAQPAAPTDPVMVEPGRTFTKPPTTKAPPSPNTPKPSFPDKITDNTGGPTPTSPPLTPTGSPSFAAKATPKKPPVTPSKQPPIKNPTTSPTFTPPIEECPAVGCPTEEPRGNGDGDSLPVTGTKVSFLIGLGPVLVLVGVVILLYALRVRRRGTL